MAMNRIFKLVWNRAQGAWTVASELAASRGKRGGGVVHAPLARAVLAMGLSIPLAAPAADLPAADLPTGGRVVAGNGNISTPDGQRMVIDQRSGKLAIDWNSFDIGSGHTVRFNQPGAGSIALNRVLGSDGSRILGALEANGRVFLINPNGVLFGKGSSVNVGGLVASTLGLSNEDFLGGRYRFSGTGGSVVNLGSIAAADGGAVALLGGSVGNQGTIVANLGTVALAAGKAITLDFAGDGLLSVRVDAATAGALAENRQLIQADGGSVIMTAQASDALLQTVVNNDGVIQARSLGERDGRVVLEGGSSGTVQVAGTLDASGADGKGGAIEVTGRHLALRGATLDASGAGGGGAVRVGGDWQGGGGLANAETASVDAASTLRADATRSGDGGSVVVWSDLGTGYAGHISATGGALGGDGGRAEVSGKAVLDFAGTVDLSAAHGAFGNLLLDPYNLTIVSGTGGGVIASADDSTLGADTLAGLLAGANVTVSTGSGGSQAGDITVAAPVTWLADTVLTLQAANDIGINGAISAAGESAGLSLDAGGDIAINAAITAAGPSAGLSLDAGGAISAAAAVNVGAFTLQSGDWNQLAATLPAFSASDFRLAGGSFLRATGGTGTSVDPYRVADVYGLQGLGTLLAHSFALAGDIDATGTADWNCDGSGDCTGFDPIGDSGTAFTGSLDGAGHTIGGLTIRRSGESYVGLFGRTGAGSSLVGLGLENVGVTGGDISGGLVGENNGGSVAGSYVSGSVAGGSNVGGLVGYNTGGSIRQSYAVGTVQGWQSIGGLVGNNSGGSIAESFASNRVAGGYYYVGGLAGANNNGGTITDAYSMGQVSGYWDVGGLVGYNLGGTVSNAYATGMVSNVAGGLGGLIAYSGSVSNGYWDSDTSGIGGGQATTALQGSLPGGFDASVWGVVDGSYPYLRWQFATGVTPQVVSGVVSNSGGGGVVGAAVSGLLGTDALTSVLTRGGVTSAANGYYYFLLNGSLDDSQVTTYYAAGATFQDSVSASLQDFDIDQNVLRVTTSAANWSGILGVLNSNATVASLIPGLATLELAASGDFALDGQVDAADARVEVDGDLAIETGLSVDSLDLSATGTISDTASLDAGIFTLNAGAWRQVATTLPAFSASDFRLAGGSFLRATGGSGTSANPWLTADVYGLQGIGTLLGSGFALANDFDASGTVNWNAGEGFKPIGDTGTPFTGSLDGQGHVIGGLVVARPTQRHVGLFGYLGSGSRVAGLGLEGGSVAGLDRVGALAGFNGGTVESSYVTTDVAGGTGIDAEVGGLVGENQGAVENSYAAGKVSGRGDVGGLVGYNNDGTVGNSYATGTVTGSGNVGGLVGWNGGSIQGSFYATTGATGQDITAGHTVVNGIARTYAELTDLSTVTDAGWDIDDQGGTGKVWRIYEGRTAPLLRSFLTGITVTGDLAGAGKTYDGTIASGTAGYITDIDGDLQGSLAYVTNSANAGTYTTSAGTLGLGGLSSTQQGYDISYSPSNALVIGKAGLTVTARDAGKTYGQTANLTSYTTSALINGDAVSAVDLTSAGAASTATVGDYTITASNADGIGLSNYDITYVDGTLSVGKAGLTIAARDAGKTYGQTANLTGYATSGLINGDAVSAVDLTSVGAASSAVVGDYTITAANADGSGLSNYDITYVDGTLTIGKAGLTITARDAGKTYDGLAWRGGNGVNYSGFVNGEDASVLGGTLVYGGTAQGAVDAGGYAITAGGLDSDNYAIRYVDGTLTILPASAPPEVPPGYAEALAAAQRDGRDARAAGAGDASYRVVAGGIRLPGCAGDQSLPETRGCSEGEAR
jgi:filamentous hemagglutinin family protein